MSKRFVRKDWRMVSKLGKRRKKKQVWRAPKGRHNKMRENNKGKPAIVNIGYRTEKKIRNKIENKRIINVNNLKDLEKVTGNELIILGKVGKKKKLEMIKKIKERNLSIYNLNVKKFLKKNSKGNNGEKNESR